MMNTELFKAIFSKDKSLEIKENEDFRVLEENDNSYVVEYNQQIYNVVIDEFDTETKKFKILLNEKPVQLQLKNNLDLLIAQLGLQSKREEDLSQLNAPMPGLVLKLEVNEGDTVEKGDALLILEAMKMENVIKSKGAGTIKKICVDVNQKVEKSQLLIEFE